MSRGIVVVIGVLASMFVLSRFLYPSGVVKHKSSPAQTQTQLLRSYGNLPLSFERNDGQTDARVKFLSRGNGYTLFLTPTEAVLTLRKPESTAKAKPAASKPQKTETEVLRIKLAGAEPSPQIEGLDRQAGRANYFIGNDPKKWRKNVPTYARVKYRNVYPGIDVAYYGSNQRRLEYDFDVAPGADPGKIRLSFDGANRLKLNDRGDLMVETAGGEVIEYAPIIYQEANGRHETISGRYAMRDKRSVGFEVAAYDARRPLFIDPVLVYSTYLGGSAYDSGAAIAIDSSGDAYVTGATRSPNFPTMSALQPNYLGGQQVFVAKLNPTGTGLVFSTYLGGSQFASYINSPFASEGGNGIAVDSAGFVYVTGATGQTDFPTTSGAFQTRFGGAGRAVPRRRATLS